MLSAVFVFQGKMNTAGMAQNGFVFDYLLQLRDNQIKEPIAKLSISLDFGHWRELLSRLLASILDPFLNGGILKPTI
jgi:hypothetical protein